MTTQTQATDQVLTDEQLEDLNGAGAVASMFWGIDIMLGLGIPYIVDDATGGNVAKAVRSHKTI